MTTRKLFQENVYLKEADLKLVQLIHEDGYVKAEFESTIFYPTGGGQLCDTGKIGGFEVADVSEKDGIIWHKIKEGSELKVGETYHAELDWNRRFDHMQMHCGEHILSGVFLKLYGVSNKGFHMGDDYVTIDMDCPSGEITQDMVSAAEKMANEIIWANLPVTTTFFPTAEEAMSLPCRKQIKFGENISVVLIGDRNDPADCCACCGTHPVTTGEVGLIKIVHSEKYKGMSRFYVKCGRKAYEDYCFRQNLTDSIARRYSCDVKDIEKSQSAEASRNGEVYKRYSVLKDYCVENAVNEIRESFKLPKEKSIRCYYYHHLDGDDLQLVARKLENDINGVVILASLNQNICIVTSDGQINCGKLVKDYASMYNGKGGGKPDLARAIFSSREDLDLYIDLVEKHLR